MLKFKSTICYYSRTLLLFTMALVIGVLSACTSGSDSGKIKAVAAENFYGEVIKAVGSDLVEVISLLDKPDADPHDYEPTPKASKAVHNAKLVVYNSLGYDEWTKKMIDASSDAANKMVIAVATDVMGKQEGDNEHVWYNPETLPKLAKLIAEKLGKLDPGNSAVYQKNADAYIATLAPLTSLIKELKQTAAVPIAVSEPIADYLVEALNLTITNKKFEAAIEEGTDPAPADIAQLQDNIKGKKIKLLVNNIQSSSAVVKNMVDLAKQSGVPVVDVTETLPTGKNYQEWMIGQLNQFKAALK